MSSKTSTSPNAERKKAGNRLTKWAKCLLRNRRILLLAMQALFWAVKLARALKNLFGDP